ncbi:protein SHORT HYPOCOTYL IN WHITE LIGHT 1-like isoform X2 [Rhododendron vialii]|uniref:protein SHORT HYPOCOTYL IN WHITE LIGHT 1-like isoform X2 n=1 Tax=Rhododendron vialii TaxID=182163 RepID=UPI00265FF1B5|nr:protein SHORT HYPOCOTYL IN WHITE LIGHT 1-like isoform X2 [Rhododendron vialii]
MAGDAAISPLVSLACTNLRPSVSPPWITLFLPQLLLLRHRHYRTSYSGRLRLVTVQRAKLNGSLGEEELENDEAFSYSSDAIEEEYESDEEDDTESSVDLLFRFLHRMFKKVSKRVRKASHSVLPSVVPPQLVSFVVDGVLLLASLSTLKALLEVACTIGGTVFVVILLLPAIWATTSYFQASGGNNFSQSGTSYGRTQPVT